MENNPEKFVCNTCSKTYTNKSHLKRHQLSCGPDKQRKHICICEAKFFRKDLLTKHQKKCKTTLAEQTGNSGQQSNETIQQVSVMESTNIGQVAGTSDAARQMELSPRKLETILTVWNKLCSDAEKELTLFVEQKPEYFM